MNGWKIFVHSVRLVLNNLGDAFRISAVLYSVQVLALVMLYANPPQMIEGGLTVNGATPEMMDPRDAFRLFAFQLAGLIASLWIAVAWHRYVLEEEYPTGWFPRWPGSRLAGYFGRSLMIGVLIGLAVVILSIPFAVLSQQAGLAQLLVLSLMIGFAAFLFFKMGPILPAAALGEPMRLSDAWSASKEHNGTVFALALIVIAVSLLVQLPGQLSGPDNATINLVYDIVTGWFITMIGASLLTTLYGVFIQGRPLP